MREIIESAKCNPLIERANSYIIYLNIIRGDLYSDSIYIYGKKQGSSSWRHHKGVNENHSKRSK